MIGVLIAAALALFALCAAAGIGAWRRRGWRTTGSGGGRGGAAGGDATGGSESGTRERGNNRRTCLCFLISFFFSRSSFSIAIFSVWSEDELRSQASALPVTLLAAAFAIQPCFLHHSSHALCENKCLEFSTNHAESSFAWGKLGETNRVESFVPTTTSTECRHCKVFF